jgi:hypothetical protein
MSVPPQPPNQWGQQPPTAGQPAGAWGPPPGGQPQWGPQQPWGPPPGPPRAGGKGKWILGGIAVLAVIAVTVVITVWVVGKDSGGESPTPTNGNGSEFASANDKGPVGIITEEPTCAAWNRIGDALSSAERGVGWRDRDVSISASAWTPEQRSQYETVGNAMHAAADQAVELAKKTPHRVMRELYEQFNAYARTFAEKVPTYHRDDGPLASATDDIATVLVSVCAAITYGSAAAQEPLVPAAGSPTSVAPPDSSGSPQRFLTESTPTCGEWLPAYEKYDSDVKPWRESDPNVPASQWSPDQRSVFEAAATIMTAFADKAEELGRASGNPTFEDFAVMSAQYRRGYVRAIPTYTPADNYLATVSTSLANAIGHACMAVGA